ncbi:26S proteasome non-ATPase regulatory subunit 9-like [Artemia franciscana]|nr:hypothetical protein QYM36_007801 [Artemia franciscana]KAK2727067.1 hypothetical protein QYM36_007801 [Artemia franciscana]KAK2727068.1 hypothetical protein QYM36_007801 [Artemia franciscana]KAK2727070.1 hypothetical protein QYM36_007801 [Artemia franciscana]
MASVEEIKSTLHSLDTKKREIEASMAAKFEILNHNRVDMSESLVDSEGYPRNDVDVYQVRHARHDIICLRNDLKNLMIQFEDNLFKLHSLTKNSSEDLQGVSPAEIPFARVSSVENMSPAFIDGLVEGDEITNFGSITEKNFKSMKDISEVVFRSVDKEVFLTIQRKGRHFKVTLRPRRWSGKGLLGCVIVPIEHPEPER